MASEKRKLTGYFVEVKPRKDGDVHLRSGPLTIESKNLNDECRQLYEYLNCEYFTVTYRTIGGKQYAIFADDEGLYNEPVITSAVDKSMKTALVGNLFIVSADTDGDGNCLSLTSSDLKHIEANSLSLVDFGVGIHQIVKVEY